ncbi:hypothetical protein [Rhizobium sp. 21-4511-3d]
MPLAFACGSRRQSFESPFEPEFPLLIVLFVVFGSTIAGLLLVVPFVPPLPLPPMLPDPDIVPVPDPLPAALPPEEPPLDDWARADVASPRDSRDTAAIFTNMISSFIGVEESRTA